MPAVRPGFCWQPTQEFVCAGAAGAFAIVNRPYPTAAGTPLHEVHLANQQDLVCLRHDTRRIAAELGVSAKTVEAYLTRLSRRGRFR